jgi:hypothetical protein
MALVSGVREKVLSGFQLVQIALSHRPASGKQVQLYHDVLNLALA